jgi:hypothetical protein
MRRYRRMMQGDTSAGPKAVKVINFEIFHDFVKNRQNATRDSCIYQADLVFLGSVDAQ